MHKAFVSRKTSNDTRSVKEQADRYVRRLQGFYAHLAAYVGVNTLLVVINLLTSPDVFWAIWPILGWGLKIGAHAAVVFGVPAYADWKARVRRRYIRQHTDRPMSASNRMTGGTRFQEKDDLESEAEHLRRRVEHLEAIVTSADWDLLADVDTSASPDRQASALADEVVSR